MNDRIEPRIYDQEEFEEIMWHMYDASPDLLSFAQQILNAIDTGEITIVTAQDETLANVLAQGRAAVQKATGAA